MRPARLHALTGLRPDMRPARLQGFARVEPAHGHPYIVPRPGAVVHGLLVEPIDAAALRRLDVYEDEGRLYRRRKVRVCVDGRRVDCETYVGHGVVTGAELDAAAAGRGRRRRPASGA
jgi:hypothetical protein